MGRYVAKRLLATIPVLLGVTLIIFGTLHVVPGNPVIAIGGLQSGPEVIAQLERHLGLDKPLYVQYGLYMKRLFHGDLGYSISRKTPVNDLLRPAIVNSAIIAIAGLILAVAGGLLVGFIAAFRRGSFLDRALVSGMLVFGTIPPFWLALLLIIVFSVQLQWLPATGMYSLRGDQGLLDLLRHLILPALAAAAMPAAIIAKVARTAMLEVRGAEFVTAARAKGLPRGRVFLRHVLLNALSPIVTLTGLQIGYLFGGAIFVEVVFGWPGVGFQLYQAVLARDIPLIMGASLVIAFFFVMINLVADLVNIFLNPRIEVA